VYKHVLVAIDGSLWSDAATDHAITLARLYQFTLCLLYVEPRRRWFAAEVQAQVSSSGPVG
jgi:nucleotide-binding universal stress UspA family protein